MPNGNYDVYVWIFEDNQSLNATLSINGNVVLPSYNTALHRTLGPLRAVLNDGEQWNHTDRIIGVTPQAIQAFSVE